VPPSAPTQSQSPVSPDPLLDTSAPPIPSSRIDKCRTWPSVSTQTSTIDARAYLAAFVKGFGDDVEGRKFSVIAQPR
jgi:hypothetical protein